MAYRVVEFPYFKQPTLELNSSIAIPSYTHAYSITTEYVKQWFLKKFGKDYFKHIWVDGSNIFDDFRDREGDERLKIDKPRLVITPTIDFDGAFMDNHGAGSRIIHYTTPYDRSFFKDYDKNIFLGLMLEEFSVNYRFRIELSTRAQQLDLYKFMNMAYRVKYAYRTSSDLDFHVPYHVMMNIAKQAGFEVKDNAIVDVNAFLMYMNAHSELPIVFKLRTVSQIPEFFIRYKDMDFKFHIEDLIQIDDGDKKGMLSTDFNIELVVNVKSIHPSSYIHYSTSGNMVNEGPIIEDPIIVGEVNIFTPPFTNEHGWGQFVTSEYVMDASELGTLEDVKIDFTELFEQINLLPLIKETNALKLDPTRFIDLVFYNGVTEIEYEMDWETCTITISNQHMEAPRSLIVLYADSEYIHTYNTNREEINKKRFQYKEVEVQTHTKWDR